MSMSNISITMKLRLILSISREDSHSALSLFIPQEWWQTIIFQRKAGAVDTN